MSAPTLTRRQWLALASAVAGGAGLSWLLQGTAPIGTDVGDSGAARAALADSEVPVLGAAGGDLTAAVFTDYRCPACRSAYPDLMAAVAADARVKLLVYDWPIFGEPSRHAARIALAATRQGKYGAVHDRLMSDSRPFETEALPELVTAAGADWSRIERDLTDHGAAIDQRLARNAQRALTLGLPGTPAYLIGPLLVVGALSQSEFTRAFAEARKG